MVDVSCCFDDLYICYPDPMEPFTFSILISLFLWINDLSKTILWVDETYGNEMFLQDLMMKGTFDKEMMSSRNQIRLEVSQFRMTWEDLNELITLIHKI